MESVAYTLTYPEPGMKAVGIVLEKISGLLCMPGNDSVRNLQVLEIIALMQKNG